MSLKSADFQPGAYSALFGIALGGAFLAPFGRSFRPRFLLIFSMAFLGLASIGTASPQIRYAYYLAIPDWLALGASLTNATR